MRLTVGPLPAAVYWRRRAAVLGALLVIVLLIVYSCGGSTPSSADQGGRAGTNGTLPTVTPSASSSTLPTLAPSTSQAATPNGTLSPSSPPVSVPPVDCTDAEMSVKASISSTSATTSKLQYGGTFTLKLVIANISGRTCTRDVGSVPEELLIEHGTTKIWSSDDCTTSTAKAHDVRTFHPGDAISAQVSWSSYDITTSACKRSTTPVAVGTYQLIGRVGTKISTPTAFTIQK